MKPFHLPDGREGLIYKTPEGNQTGTISITNHGEFIFTNINGGYDNLCELPEGTWQILADTDSMSEEVAHQIVPHDIETEYPEYGAPYDIIIYEGGHDTAIDALKEWLWFDLGLDPENRYIILVKGS